MNVAIVKININILSVNKESCRPFCARLSCGSSCSFYDKKQSLHIQTIESMTIYLLIWTRERETRELLPSHEGDFRHTNKHIQTNTSTSNTQHTTLFIMQNYKLFFKLFMNLSGIVFSMSLLSKCIHILYERMHHNLEHDI